MPEKRPGGGGGAGCLLAVAALLLGGLSADAVGQQADWPTYGHDPGGMRYSPLTQIDTSNVAQLQPAWTYHMRPASAGQAAPEPQSAPETAQRAAEGTGPLRRRNGRFSQSEATPLVVGGLMYVSTPYRRVVALEPETGTEVWAYQLPGSSQPSVRGVEYWPGDGKQAPEIVFGTRDGLLIALDAKSGQPVEGFGSHGIVDMKTPDVMPAVPAQTPFGPGGVGMTSPPLVYHNLVITGSIVQEFPQLGAYGDVRAWDARTGQRVWNFHTVPRPGEYGHNTWAGDSWRQRSGTNVWGLMTLDVERGIVYMPLGAPTWDRYGGDRVGANLFGTSVVALDANTGKRLWHFQVVHHDIWDMDAEAPPLLLDVRQGKHTVPAVAIVSKSGLFFLLDRVNGKPIFKIEERKVPASDVPGEQAWPTQPFPVKPAPLARQTFSMADVATVTPELEAFCRQFIDSNHLRMGGPYLPLGYKTATVNFPGRQGGANWGGGSFDPTLGYFFINTNNLGQVEQLRPRDDGSWTTGDPSSGRFSERDDQLMCQQPPWGLLTAINVNTGEIAWQSTLGVSDKLPAAVARTGRPGVGGPIATAGGLVFIGASDDARFRAFDARSGAELWTFKLAASAHATPITYLGRNGRQYVVVVNTGGSFLDSPVVADEVTAFALPAAAQGIRPPDGRPPDPYAGKKKILIVGDLHTGNQIAHDALSHAMATLERLGRESGAYIAFIRTDTEWVTKSEVWGTGDYVKGGRKQARGHNLNDFDAVVFYTNGDTDLSEQQKKDLLAYVHDDGRGFVAVHTATSTMLNWPQYGEMVGGYFDDHPWNIVAAPLVVERPDFPGLRNLRPQPVFTDEMYQYKLPYSREQVDVLARLDTRSLDMSNKRIHRTDGDFPVAWIKTYGKGRVFSSTFGHSDQSWDDPRVQTLYLEAIKWVLGLSDYEVKPHPMTPPAK